MPDTVALLGESFTIADRVGLMALMRFAKIAKSGVDSNELEGLTAMYDLLEQCIAEDEWERFCAHAQTTRADATELFAVVTSVLELLTARPTRRPSGSSDGPGRTGTSSTGDSSSQVIVEFAKKGRPDLASIVRQRQESLAG